MARRGVGSCFGVSMDATAQATPGKDNCHSHHDSLRLPLLLINKYPEAMHGLWVLWMEANPHMIHGKIAISSALSRNITAHAVEFEGRNLHVVASCPLGKTLKIHFLSASTSGKTGARSSR